MPAWEKSKGRAASFSVWRGPRQAGLGLGLALLAGLAFGNRITARIEAGLPAIRGDERKLRQVFNNLLANAVDANTINNDNALKISAARVRVNGASMIEVRISDNGPGIDAGLAGEVFEPYVTGKRKGTGLGLAIVKRIIDEHQGRVWLENNPGGAGASAVIRLAAYEADTRAAAKTA